MLRKNENSAKAAFEKKYKGMYLRELVVNGEADDAEYNDMVIIDVVRSKVGQWGAKEWQVETNLLLERTLEDGSVVMEQAPIPPPEGAGAGRAVVDNRALYRIGPELHALIVASNLNEGFYFRTSPNH